MNNNSDQSSNVEKQNANTQVTKTKVEIMGNKYTLKGDVDPDYMVSLASYVNEKLSELKEIAPEADPVRLALLMSLNLADELFQERNSKKGLVDASELQEMQQKTIHLISILEDGLIGDLD